MQPLVAMEASTFWRWTSFAAESAVKNLFLRQVPSIAPRLCSGSSLNAESQVNDTAIGLVRSNEDADHAAMRDLVLVRWQQFDVMGRNLILRQDRMNALWPNVAQHPSVEQVQAAAASAASSTEPTVASVDSAPAAVPLKPSAISENQQALQLLHANRKLEAQVQVLPRCWSC